MGASELLPLRVGLAGLGFGAAVHLPALLGLEAVQVMAIAGTRMDRTLEIARAHGVPHARDSVEALLELPLDAVVLALPPHVNETAVALALQRGAAVFCEKPIAVTSGVAADLAAQAIQPTGVDFEFMELQTFQTLERLVREGAFGRIRHVSVSWLTASWAYRSRTWSWKTDSLLGGGVVALLGSHILYLIERLFGTIMSISAVADRPLAEAFAPDGCHAAVDTVSLVAVLESGATVSVVLSNAAPDAREHRWTIVGDRRTSQAVNTAGDWASGFALSWCGASPSDVIIREPRVGEDGRIAPVRSLLGRFMSAVRGGPPMQPDLSAGARVQQLMTAIQTSAAQGRVEQPA